MLSSVNRPPKVIPYPQNPIYPLFTPGPPLKKNFKILGGLLDPPSEKKVRDIYVYVTRQDTTVISKSLSKNIFI